MYPGGSQESHVSLGRRFAVHDEWANLVANNQQHHVDHLVSNFQESLGIICAREGLSRNKLTNGITLLDPTLLDGVDLQALAFAMIQTHSHHCPLEHILDKARDVTILSLGLSSIISPLQIKFPG